MKSEIEQKLKKKNHQAWKARWKTEYKPCKSEEGHEKRKIN